MKVSASRLWLLDQCQWWARPEVVAPPDVFGEPAATGKAFHLLAEAHVAGLPLPTTFDPKANVAKAVKMHARFIEWWPSVDDGGWLAEVVFLYDWRRRTVERRPREWADGDRDRAPTQIPIIVDLLNTKRPRVWDHKTGAHVDRVADSPQVKAGALVRAREIGAGEVEGGIVKIRARSLPVLDPIVWDALDLSEFEDWLGRKMAAAPTSEPQRGAGCWRCPVRSVCPALAAPEPPHGRFDDDAWPMETDGGQDG